ncbi:MAG: hypothetical protein AAFZ63_29465 [Bacteroidota bacterium]
MKYLTVLFLLSLGTVHAQVADYFTTEFLLGGKLNSENLIADYKGYDFSRIWTKTENSNVYGVIGEDHQRLRLKLITVEKNPFDSTEYIVYGKSMVKNTICDFTGVIRINEIRTFNEFHFGVDNEYEHAGIKSQGILIGAYEFRENREQVHSGIFKGELSARWYLNKDDQMVYDDIQLVADGYVNNAFVGVWRSDASNNEKLCNWGDYRVPMANEDFDIGVAELSVSDKYRDKGWEDTGSENTLLNMRVKWWE